MPLLLDDLDLKPAAAKKTDAKFFSPQLTGSGMKAGLLNNQLYPVAPEHTTVPKQVELKTTTTQHDISTVNIPLAALTRRSLESLATATLPTPEVDDRFVVETDSDVWDVVFDMTPQSLVLREDKSDRPIKREVAIQYRTQLCLLRGGLVEPERIARMTESTNLTAVDSTMILDWDTSPMDSAAEAITLALGRMGIAVTNIDELEAWMLAYSVHDRIARLAIEWDSDKIAEEVCAFIADIAAAGDLGNEQLNALAIQLRYLENYSVRLEAYGVIHQALEQAFDETISETLAKQNLNLLMNHTLAHLETLKPHLTIPARPVVPPVMPTHLSDQQLGGITTHEPLSMVQAGAGTGKTSTIIERIDYLVQCGVKAQDITVISFTNAAAENIKDRNPDVGSMTIASMINDIYQLNHPGHDISSIDTIINSLEIFFPTDPIADAFRSRLLNVDKNKVGACTALNTFVETHYDRVMEFLDTIRQTSLELEIIVCYQRIDEMIEPAHVQCRHLIIDEVQDNSVFEFIYVLKYISKHHQSLFIVGDASQTLFEFRSANPRALNTLEGSGVFATYKLTTNYRSNQEILDFANVVLGDLETNQFADIQLQANSLESPTPESFNEKVTLNYHQVSQMKGFMTETFGQIFANTILPEYVDKCLERGEQVAFMAYSRRDVATMQTALEAIYPHKKVASLVSEKVFATDIFSKYIKFFWNDVLQVPPNNATLVVTRGIRDNMEKLTKNASNQKVERAVLELASRWWTENTTTINGWLTLVHQGAMPAEEFYSRLRDNLLSFEIAQNAVKKSMVDARNRARKEKNLESQADLLVTTIHGVKGLEFDNTVVLHKDDKDMSQETRRLYYVAFTRAKKSEYIFSYGSTDKPMIVSTHEAIGNLLQKQQDEAAEKEKRARAQALGLDPDLLDDEGGSQDTPLATSA